MPSMAGPSLYVQQQPRTGGKLAKVVVTRLLESLLSTMHCVALGPPVNANTSHKNTH